MKKNRTSIGNSPYAFRIRKFDTYHDDISSKRDVQRTTKISNIRDFDYVNHKPKKNVAFKPDLPKIKYGDKPAPKIVHNNSKQPAVIKLALSAVNSAPATNNALINDQFNNKNIIRNITAPRTKFQTVFYVFGLLVFFLALSVSIQTLVTNWQAKDQLGAIDSSADEQGVSEGTGNNPSEEEVSAYALTNYRVNPEDPRYIRIPSLRVYSRIKNLGIDNKGAVDAPWNIHDAGWYNGSSKPGTVGSSLIVGHVSGWSGPGVFKNIEKLNVGDSFEIEKGSGEIIKYQVTKTESMHKDQVNMSDVLSTETAGKHGIKLMTCAGKYDENSETFLERRIVNAKAI